MTTLTRRGHAFGTSINLDEVERLLLEWPAGTDEDVETTLDLGECQNVEPGAGYRLANAMRRWAAGRLVVSVPDDADLGGSAWFRLFTRSGLGLAMASHADQVSAIGGRAVTDRVRDYYSDRSAAHASNCVMFTGLESGALVPTPERFASTLLAAIASHLPAAQAGLPGEARRSLVRLTNEAVCNVVDHAFRLPWREQGERLSYLSVRWYRSLSAKTDELGGLRGYLGRCRDDLGEGERLAGWVEVVVADDGNGIPARHAQADESQIYGAGLEAERQTLVEALAGNSTVKVRTLDCEVRGDPGYGTTIILGRLTRLSAYAALRTGRCLVEYNPFEHGDFTLWQGPLGWMPGTALQVVLPVRDPQLRLG